MDEVSGSTGLSGGADGILVLKRDRGRADAYLHVTGREIEEEAELALRWDADLASWALVGDADEYRVSNERQQLLQALQNAEALMSPKEIAEALSRKLAETEGLAAVHGWLMSGAQSYTPPTPATVSGLEGFGTLYLEYPSREVL